MEAPKALLGSLILLLLLFLQCAVAQKVSLTSAAEHRAMPDLRSSLGLRSRDWPINADPCLFWTGVHCENGRVTGITIAGLKRTRLGRRNASFNVVSLANFEMLTSFNSSGFSLPGSIPEWFGNRFPKLEVLDLRSCGLSGSIPDSFGNLSRLHSLFLSDNDLSGSIPDGLGKLIELQTLDLSGNSLTGSISYSLGSLYNLQFLNLSDNNFSALIPSQLGYLSRLVELDLSKNSLSGSLPQELKGLRSLQKMVIGENELEGILPDGLFSSLVELHVVDLSGNKLDGTLPATLWSMPKLRFLDVSSNNFTGELTSLGSYRNVTAAAINLSSNSLHGPLNFQFGDFKFIDLSGNYFEGAVLDEDGRNVTLKKNCLQVMSNQRPFVDCRLFYAERGLSFGNFEASDALRPPLKEKNSGNRKRLIFILPGVLGGLGFIAISILLFVICNKCIANQRGKQNVRPIRLNDSPYLLKDFSIPSGPGQQFPYEQLLQATLGFSELYLIKKGHSGAIYRGDFEGQSTIAIKKVSLRSVTKESCAVELELFSKLLHARFVPLLGHCLEHERDKLLVYKYMPNGDLASSFYRATNSADGKMQSLDWITRSKIAIGVAEGLSYLHHECNPPLVHRDVQASSILLDHKFEVRLGSLSEVCVQEGDPHHNVLTGFLGKPQADEPSTSGQSPANCAYDVYCFGKVLLELITGNLGISGTDNAATKEWLDQTLACINVYSKELVTKIMDPSLAVDEDLLEEMWAMVIVARSCLNPKPWKRPTMKHVLKALENPLKVVREASFCSARLRTTSSSRMLGCWLQSYSENGHTNREGLRGSKQFGRIGDRGRDAHSHERKSNEIFPESFHVQELEMLVEH